MHRAGPEVVRLAERYRLAVDERQSRGLAGERLGKGTGNSLEFQERRAYVAGDDIRHLDWGAYARTDQLMVRLYREEISPRVELLLDDSASLATEPEKARRQVELALLLAQCARESGFQLALWAIGDEPRRLDLAQLESEGLALAGRAHLGQWVGELAGRLHRGAHRLLVSDFLFPHEPRALVRALAAGAGRLDCVQVLGTLDVEPPVGEALRLTDAETGATLDMVLDRAAVDAYLGRLERLRTGLEGELRGVGGRFASLAASESLEAACRGPLCRRGLLAPA